MPKSKSRSKLLSSTRPPISAISPSPSHLSSKTTSSIIRTHHTLTKQLHQARKTKDADEVALLEKQIQANGGLELYQQASTQGQSNDRGGDTSRVLVGWLRGYLHPLSQHDPQLKPHSKLRILEVGALSPTNALNIPSITEVRRIDLRSNHPSIEQQDFMTLSPEEIWQGGVGYDVLSLSLVVNFVGDPRARGEMLRYTTRFLRHRHQDHDRPSVNDNAEPQAHLLSNEASDPTELLPALFLVLPLPCIDNSRYLTEPHLLSIMSNLGYAQTRVKRTAKLYYSLWTFQASDSEASGNEQRGKGGGAKDAVKEDTRRGGAKTFKKVELRKGKDRNNFCIVLDNEIP